MFKIALLFLRRHSSLATLEAFKFASQILTVIPLMKMHWLLAFLFYFSSLAVHAEKKHVTIGIIAPLSGEYAALALNELLGTLIPYQQALGLAYIEPTAPQLLAAYEKFYGKKSTVQNNLSALFYDSMQVLLDTYQPDYSPWREGIKIYSKKGATGLITFNDKGDRIPQIHELKTLQQVAIEEGFNLE